MANDVGEPEQNIVKAVEQSFVAQVKAAVVKFKAHLALVYAAGHFKVLTSVVSAVVAAVKHVL